MAAWCPECGCEYISTNVYQVFCATSCNRHWRRNGGETLIQRIPSPIPAPPSWRSWEVPVVIVAHTKRTKHAQELAEEVTAEAVMMDDAELGGTVNHIRALRWLAAGNCPWSVVLEDDAKPLPDFRRQLHDLLKVAPSPIVSLYLGRDRPPHWQSAIARVITPPDSDPHFLMCNELLHGVGYAIRTSLLAQMVKELDPVEPIDVAVSQWAQRHRRPVAHTRPSIVNHRDELAPVIAERKDNVGRDKGRIAWVTGTRPVWNSSREWIPVPQELGGPQFHRTAVG